MTNKPDINVCSTLNQASVVRKQKQLECTIIAPNSKIILAVTSTPVLEKCDVEGKFIKVEGVVYTKVLYEDNDGNNCVIDNKCNFADIVETVDGLGKLSCLGSVTLSDLEFKTNNSDEIKATILLHYEICVFSECETQYAECDSDDLCVLSDEVAVSTLLCAQTESFGESFELELGKNVARVLDCGTSVALNNTTVSNGQVVVDATIVNTLVYETLDDNHTLANRVIAYDFKQTFDGSSLDDDCTVFANISIMSDKLQVVCEDVEGNMLVHIDYPMSVQYVAVGSKSIRSLSDAYSTTNEISIERAPQGVISVVGNVHNTEKIDTNVTLEKDTQTIEKVYSYNINNIDLTKLIADGEWVLVEGVAYCNIVFQSYDRETELNGNSSIVAEIPFATKLQLGDLQADDVLLGKASPVSVDVRIKRSQELDIIAELQFDVSAIRNQSVDIVRDIEIGEEKTPNTNALSIYLVQKGKTYWDIAKQLSVNVDELQFQNEDIALPSDKVEKLVYYRQLHA